MALPITIPNTFANATASIPLANLDANFTTVANAINGIGNGSEALANVSITGGNAVFTSANATTSTITNFSSSNVAITGGNVNAVTMNLVTISSGNAVFTNANATNSTITNFSSSNVTITGGTATLTTANATNLISSNVNLTGGTLTNVAIDFQDQLATRPTLKDYSINGQALGALSANTALNFANANFFSATANANLTFSFSNASAANTLSGVVLALSNGGSKTLTWANVDWTGGVAPTLTSNGLDILVFVTYDAGTTIHGMVASLDSK